MRGRPRKESLVQKLKRREKAKKRILGLRPHDWIPTIPVGNLNKNRPLVKVWICSRCKSKNSYLSDATKTCIEEIIRYVMET